MKTNKKNSYYRMFFLGKYYFIKPPKEGAYNPIISVDTTEFSNTLKLEYFESSNTVNIFIFLTLKIIVYHKFNKN